MRVSILIMAFLPPFNALTSASSARAPASLHWASRSFLSFSRFIATSCSQRSSSARRAASTIARAALSSESLASLVISSKSAPSWLYSDSNFLFAAAMDWLTFPDLQVSHWYPQALAQQSVSGDRQSPTVHDFLQVQRLQLIAKLQLCRMHLKKVVHCWRLPIARDALPSKSLRIPMRHLQIWEMSTNPLLLQREN